MILLLNLFGWLSVFLHFVAFLTKDRKKMLVFNLCSTSLLGLSMIPYGGFNGVVMCLFSAILKTAGLLGYGQNYKDIYKAAAGFILGLIYFYFFNTEGALGLLPAFSLIFIMIADLQSDVLKMKLWYYGSAACWLTYAISIAAPPAIAYDVIGIFALSYSVYQIYSSRTKNIQDVSE